MSRDAETVSPNVEPSSLSTGRASGVSSNMTSASVRKVTPDAPQSKSQEVSSQDYKKTSGYRFFVRYMPRFSMFDSLSRNEMNGPFRGFYNLFWICLACVVLSAFTQSFDNTGQILSLTLATLMSKDTHVLALSDAILVAQTFLCVPLVHGLRYFRITHRYIILTILLLWHITTMVNVIIWTRFRDWPWVQSGFFVLHSIVQMMKIHSYVDVNSAMNEEHLKLLDTEKQLLDRVVEVDGTGVPSDKEKAWHRAAERTLQQLDQLYPEHTADSRLKDVYFKWADLRVQSGCSNERAHVLLPLLRNDIPRSRTPVPEDQRKIDVMVSDSASYPHPKLVMDLRDLHPFIWHSDDKIRSLAHDIAVIRESLYAASVPGQGLSTMWPHNVTLANFLDFQLVPTLVYKLQYPRRNEIRPWYIADRCIALFGTFLVTYVITVNWIIPVVEDKSSSLLSIFLRLMTPMISCYCILFYLMFECVCQGFAEITGFADREFYQDWWNSTSMDEYARKWNRPVHHFLLQHVYFSMVVRYGMSKQTASTLTFLISSVFHELVMIIVTGKIRGYLFVLQMSQIPLMFMARLQFIRARPVLGNILFWAGMIIGLPILNILYIVF